MRPIQKRRQTKQGASTGDNKTFAAFCMDLESVLLDPSSEASTMYLKTKLAVHNFTGYHLASGIVTCYVWN